MLPELLVSEKPNLNPLSRWSYAITMRTTVKGCSDIRAPFANELRDHICLYSVEKLMEVKKCTLMTMSNFKNGSALHPRRSVPGDSMDI